MEEQLRPIKIDNKENLEQIKNIENISLPEVKKDIRPNDIINNLPEWSIEPPIEINRGEQ